MILAVESDHKLLLQEHAVPFRIIIVAKFQHPMNERSGCNQILLLLLVQLESFETFRIFLCEELGGNVTRYEAGMRDHLPQKRDVMRHAYR